MSTFPWDTRKASKEKGSFVIPLTNKSTMLKWKALAMSQGSLMVQRHRLLRIWTPPRWFVVETDGPGLSAKATRHVNQELRQPEQSMRPQRRLPTRHPVSSPGGSYYRTRGEELQDFRSLASQLINWSNKSLHSAPTQQGFSQMH